MQTLYLKNYNLENEKSFTRKLAFFCKRLFNVFDVKCTESIVICNIPLSKTNNPKRMNRISKKICKKFLSESQRIGYKSNAIKIPKRKKEYIINKIVLDKNLEKLDILRNTLANYNVEILNGRWLFKYILLNVLDYISGVQEEQLETENVSILVNNSNEINMNLITLIARKVKMLSIITNNISKFKYVEEKLYNEYGIALEISNNRRKSLTKSDIIINIDFDEELLNKFKINNKAIIININGKKNIHLKSFSGININYYKIDYKPITIFEENDLSKSFSREILYESYIHRRDNLYNILGQIKRDGVVVTSLIGNSGKINEQEFKKNIKV